MGEGDAMNRLIRVGRVELRLGLCLVLFCLAATREAGAQLSGLFRSAPGTLATYEYHHGEFEEVLLPVDLTIRFSNDNPTSMFAAIIHRPIIGAASNGSAIYPIASQFPMAVTGTSSDGRRFFGDLLGTQYLFDWDIVPAAGGTLLLNGHVGWAGGRYEMTTIVDAPLIPIIPGDYDRDGAVTAADYVVWREMLGQSGTLLAADGDGDGEVDSTDYDVWRSHFGQTNAGGTSVGSAIPEPATLLMLLVSLLAISVRSAR